MLDRAMLQREIDMSGLKNKFIADRLGISVAALWRKTKGETEFKVSEIDALCDLLNFSSSKRDVVFFAKRVN